MTPAVRVEHLSKSFAIPSHRSWTLKERLRHPIMSSQSERLEALKDVSFEVSQGEFFAVVGRNGSGKSTLLRCLAGIHEPDTGTVEVDARIAPFIELGVGFHPQLAARDNVEVAGTLMGLRPTEARRRFPSVISFAELDQFVEMQLGNYSSGMQVRLAFSTSFQVDADILLFDEVLAVGDELFRRKCLATFERLIERGHTIVYVTHGLDTVRQFADRVLLLDEGRPVALGAPEAVLEEYDRLNREHERARPAAPPPTEETRVEVPSYPEAPGAFGMRRFVDVTLTLARAEFKLRYLDSVVGYVWALMQPLLLFLVLYFVWFKLFDPGRGIPDFELALLLGVALYTFFSEATGHALSSLVAKGAMLRKIPFSPLALPVSSVLTSFYVYGLTLVIAIAFIVVAGVSPRAAWVEMIPLVALLLVYTVGVALLLALLYVRIRDVQQVWTVLLRLMFFLTPVFYPIELAPNDLEEVLMLNPLSVITVEGRHVLIDPSAPSALDVAGPAVLAASFGIIAAVVVAGLLLYRKQARLVAERI